MQQNAIQERVHFILISPRTLCFRYLLELPHWGNSNKYPKHMFLEVLNTIFLPNFWLIVIAWAKGLYCTSQIIIRMYFAIVLSVGIKRLDYIV